MSERYDVVIVGAGIAGASLAAEIADKASVLLLEAEEQPGYHSTGRSAAFWSETYGGPLIQPLTTASYAFLAEPPAAFSEAPFLGARGSIHIAGSKVGEATLVRLAHDFAGSVALEPLGRLQLEAALPGLRPRWEAGLAEASCRDIDVAALHGAYLKKARKSGARLESSARLQTAQHFGDGWLVETSAGRFEAGILANAAGAWADDVASAAGVQPIGIQPYRRTIVQLRIDPPAPPSLPLIMDAEAGFYFKPEAGGRLWLSPHDETPCSAADCAAEELDVAIAIERLGQVVEWRIEAVERSWAGLRSFAPDRLPVYGFDAGVGGFFWFAGQGGFGIQTAPAAAKLAASLLLGSTPEPMVANIDPAPYAPGRFMN